MNSKELLENTEIMETDVETDVETVIEVSANTQILEQVYNDVHMMLILSLLKFCLSCFRFWRKFVIKGVK